MRVLSLNIWGGSLRDLLLDFVWAHRDTEILCFQEVYHQAASRISTDENPVTLDIFEQIKLRLRDHRGYFRPVVGDSYGLAIFVRSDLPVLDQGEVSIYENPNYGGAGPEHGRILQWVQLRGFTVCNVHGLWNGRGKGDSPERLIQSARITNFVQQHALPTILCGDLNLRLDTLSVQMLEESLDNLIARFSVTNTRTSHYLKAERMADYFFVSPALAVDRFCVLADEVSDHAPLLLHLKPICA